LVEVEVIADPLAYNPVIKAERSIDHIGSETNTMLKEHSSGGFWSMVKRLNQRINRIKRS